MNHRLFQRFLIWFSVFYKTKQKKNYFEQKVNDKVWYHYWFDIQVSRVLLSWKNSEKNNGVNVKFKFVFSSQNESWKIYFQVYFWLFFSESGAVSNFVIDYFTGALTADGWRHYYRFCNVWLLMKPKTKSSSLSKHEFVSVLTLS